MFIIHFENALKKPRKTIKEQCPLPITPLLYQNPPSETTNADDFDHITTDEKRNEKFNEIFANILIKDNLKIHITSENTNIERGEDRELWRKVKKLDSLFGGKEGIKRRKQIAIASMNKYEKCGWKTIK